MGDVTWDESLDPIIETDQVLAVAHRTPAGGVVLTPMTNVGPHDRSGGVVRVNTSIGMWRKLDRLRQDPQVAVAFHSREHGGSDRPEYVLVQGEGRFDLDEADSEWGAELRTRWERAGGQSRDVGPLWEWWLRVYHRRVSVEVTSHRVISWPDLACSGRASFEGAPVPGPPTPQRPPAKGTEPRVGPARLARRARRLPDVLLGWVGGDGFPVVLPVQVGDVSRRGLRLELPPGTFPPGGRRAGLLAHRFSRNAVGQDQLQSTGWLTADGDEVVFAPHTRRGYRLPASRAIYNLGAGFVTRRGLRAARRAGFVDR